MHRVKIKPKPTETQPTEPVEMTAGAAAVVLGGVYLILRLVMKEEQRYVAR